MIDLFISTCAEDSIRAGMCRATIARWMREADVSIKILQFGNPSDALRGHESFVVSKRSLKNPGPFDASERERRIIADDMAQSDIYILADDDILPLQKNFVMNALAVMRAHPQFAKVCLYTIPDHPQKEAGSFQDDDIFQVHGGGGVRFIRKGIAKQWEPSDGQEGYDAPHCREIYRRGFKVGYFKNFTGLHLGWGHTTGGKI
jgi:hypothetical protein